MILKVNIRVKINSIKSISRTKSIPTNFLKSIPIPEFELRGQFQFHNGIDHMHEVYS